MKDEKDPKDEKDEGTGKPSLRGSPMNDGRGGSKPPHPAPLLHKGVEERENTREVSLHEPAVRTNFGGYRCHQGH